MNDEQVLFPRYLILPEKELQRLIDSTVNIEEDYLVEQAAMLSVAFQKLTTRQQQSLDLYFRYKWQPGRIAGFLKIERSSVRMHIRRGVRSLLEALGKEDEFEEL